MHPRALSQVLLAVVLLSLASFQAFAVTTTKKKPAGSKKSLAKRAVPVRTVRASSTRFRNSFVRTSTRKTGPGSFIKGGPWREPTFADSTDGDATAGEDPQVRRAASEALGPYNGTVVVADPYTGRILSLVNQKLALKSGYQPCSTIKIVAALAALSEGIVEKDTVVRSSRRGALDLTKALAVSDNAYFATLGHKLGFERVVYYARLYGLGEKAGLGIDGEQAGQVVSSLPPAGLGMMTSFGSGFSLTPLELTALISSIANGGTLYYLQHPKTAEEASSFIPRVKRHLDFQQWIPDIKPGMSAAVEYGTARRAGAQNVTDTIFGKTGTCTDEKTPTHLGWFGSFNDVGRNKLVVVVLLTGGRPVNGAVASGIAGAVYKNLSTQNYFAQSRPITPSALISTQACCSRY